MIRDARIRADTEEERVASEISPIEQWRVHVELCSECKEYQEYGGFCKRGWELLGRAARMRDDEGKLAMKADEAPELQQRGLARALARDIQRKINK